MEDIKSRGYFCNSTDETVIISQRERDDRDEKKKMEAWLRKKKKRLIGKKKESEGMRDDMKMTLIKRWNDAIWRAKERVSLIFEKI